MNGFTKALTNNAAAVAVTIGGGLFVVWLLRNQFGNIVNAFNPLNEENVFANTLDRVTGLEGRGSSVGSSAFDAVNIIRGCPEYDPNDPRTDPDQCEGRSIFDILFPSREIDRNALSDAGKRASKGG